MTFIQSMYQKTNSNKSMDFSDKNPNRVSGGLRGQGVDHVVFMSEDGSEKAVTTLKYTQSLEHKINEQQQRISRLEKDNNKITKKISQFARESDGATK